MGSLWLGGRTGRGVLMMGVVGIIAMSGCAGGGRGCGHETSAAAACLVLVRMETSAGDIELELDPVRAPIGVGNFLNHAAKGQYDGTVFHRTIPTFVIQGGGWTWDPATRMLSDRGAAAKAAGDAEDTIVNEWQNGLKNVRGTIAWARDEGPDTATREFYINVADNPKLDTARPQVGNAGYAVFGRVVKGMEVVDRIKDAPTESRPDIAPQDGGLKDVPVEPVVIRRIHVLR
jgi:cyclophilin family peptidyl-prolyl cis-trans isomerase